MIEDRVKIDTHFFDSSDDDEEPYKVTGAHVQHELLVKHGQLEYVHGLSAGRVSHCCCVLAGTKVTGSAPLSTWPRLPAARRTI